MFPFDMPIEFSKEPFFKQDSIAVRLLANSLPILTPPSYILANTVDSEPNMTEQEWLTSTDPREMLVWLWQGPLRQLKSTNRRLKLLDDAFIENLDMNALALHSSSFLSQSTAQTTVAFLRDIFGNPFHQALYCTKCGLVTHDKVYEAEGGGHGHTDCWQAVTSKPTVEKRILEWNNDLIPKLARQIYQERTFCDLPKLADALEEAGCQDEQILNHCRGLLNHCRGCWVIDVCLNQK